MFDKNNDTTVLFGKIFSLIKSNFSLFLIYPITILINFKIIKIFSDSNNLKLYLIIVLISQFEIGYIKEIVVNQKRLFFRHLLLLLATSITVFSILFYFIISYFSVVFHVNLILVLVIGIVLNEIKSFFDSQKKYDYGYAIKAFFLILLPFLFLLNEVNVVFVILLIILTGLSICFYVLISKFSDFNKVALNTNLNFFRFFIINFFSFFGGNIDRFLIFPNVNKTFFDQYVVFTESNSKLNSAFGFLNNLFFFGHLKLSKFLFSSILLLLLFCFCFIQYYFNLSYDYFVYSFSTLLSILGQYFVFSLLRDIKHAASSFFSAIGIFVFIVLFFVFKTYFSITIYSLTLIIVLKNFAELFFLNLIKNRQNNKII